jgi:hypothetical protein
MNSEQKYQVAMTELERINSLLLTRCINHSIEHAETKEALNDALAKKAEQDKRE